jgi:hypothetical protein
MGWLTQTFGEASIAWLLVTSIVAAIFGFLSSWLTSRYVTHPEALDQAAIKKEVDLYLADKSAEREYNLEARKRLYHAIGPLKFQLLLACRDLTTRVYNLHTQAYDNSMRGYYGQSTLFRILRPIAISEIIEQQIAYADFSIDQTAIGLLRFKRAAYMALTDGDPILNHPNANWKRQQEHLYSGNLNNLAHLLIVDDTDAGAKSRTMNFHEFQAFLQLPGKPAEFNDLGDILEDFSIGRKPIFWIRLVCLGYICNEYLEQEGKPLGFETSFFDLRKLISASQDDYICSHVDEYQTVIQSLPDTSL